MEKSPGILKEELSILRDGAGIIKYNDPTVIMLHGNDVLDYLHRITTQSLKDLAPLQSKFTVFTNAKGRIIDRVQILNIGSRIVLTPSHGKVQTLKRWIDKFIITDDVKIDENLKIAVLDIHGSQAISFASWYFSDLEISFNDYGIKHLHIAGRIVYAFKSKTTNGNDFIRFILDADFLDSVITILLEKKGPFRVGLISEEVAEYQRVHEGIAGENELSDEFNPLEALLMSDISFTKGCYIGQEVIARLDTYDKVQKKLKVVKLEPFETVLLPSIVYDSEGNEAGTITSLVKNPYKDYGYGLAYIKKNYYNATKLFVNSESSNQVKLTVNAG